MSIIENEISLDSMSADENKKSRKWGGHGAVCFRQSGCCQCSRTHFVVCYPYVTKHPHDRSAMSKLKVSMDPHPQPCIPSNDAGLDVTSFHSNWLLDILMENVTPTIDELFRRVWHRGLCISNRSIQHHSRYQNLILRIPASWRCFAKDCSLN